MRDIVLNIEWNGDLHCSDWFLSNFKPLSTSSSMIFTPDYSRIPSTSAIIASHPHS